MISLLGWSCATQLQLDCQAVAGLRLGGAATATGVRVSAAPHLAFDRSPDTDPLRRDHAQRVPLPPDGSDRATVLFPKGYDAPAEDSYLYAAPAVRRGYAVLAFEGLAREVFSTSSASRCTGARATMPTTIAATISKK